MPFGLLQSQPNQATSYMSNYRINWMKRASSMHLLGTSSFNQHNLSTMDMEKTRSVSSLKLEFNYCKVLYSHFRRHHALICVLNKLVNWERGVVGLHDSIRHLGRREDRECQHHAVRVLLPDLGDEQGAHSWTSTSSQRVADLEPCSIKGEQCIIMDQ